ncbi:MAG: hypothetical protein R3248_14870 [Candidatus Promineifilaceae bacterium]|nr:hypothetical protein [Candidatus Promineifilaceae bacterium]
MAHNYLVLSDLHLSEGVDPHSGKLSRNEDFFHDDAFASLLGYHLALGRREDAADHYGRPWKLIINGDIFDFLQVTALPAEGDELEAVTGVRTYAELTANERRYGLGTTAPETVWKLDRIKAGHALFFRALGWFLAANPDNELILIKGNHDVELFWPAVQRRLRELVAEAYAAWHEEAEGGQHPDHPLWYDRSFPATLDPSDLRTRLRFPPWFYHERDLLYAEHGNQYDPANAFVDFLKPILPEDESRPQERQRVALPSGSLFVRYLFNQVEDVHPFADNMKPMTSYLRWAFTKEPLATLRLLITNRRQLPDIIGNLLEKRADPVRGQPELRESLARPTPMADSDEEMVRGADEPQLPLSRQRRAAIQEMRKEHLKQASERSTAVAQGTVQGIAFNAGVFLWLGRMIRNFIDRKYGRMLVDLGLAAASFVLSTVRAREIEEIEDYARLRQVGQKVCEILNRPDGRGRRSSTRYHLFGHDHIPDVTRLEDDSDNHPDYTQWYVNTGCWLATFHERTQLTRGHVQLTFFRLVPGLNDDGDAPPLLEWRPERGSARPALLFTPPQGAPPAPLPDPQEASISN